MSKRMRVWYCWLFALLTFVVVAYAPQAFADEADASGQESTPIQDEAVIDATETTEGSFSDVSDEEAAADALPPQLDSGDETSEEPSDVVAQDQVPEAAPELPMAVETEPVLESQASAVASGKCGTCPWTLDSAGKLTISAGNLASNTDLKPNFWPWYTYRNSIKSVVISGQVEAGRSMAYIFEGCTKLTSVNFTSLIGDYVDFRYAFAGCTSLPTLSTKTWRDWIYPTCTQHMFSGCTSLTSFDFSGFDLTDLRDASYMFSGCTSLATLTLTGVDESFGVDVTDMLAGCTKLTTFVNKWCVNSILDQLPTGMWTVQGTTTSYIKDRNGWVGELPELGSYTLVKTSKVPQKIVVHNTLAVVGRDTNLWVTVSSGNTPVYELDDTSLAEIDDRGVVTGKVAGSTSLTVTVPETEDYAKGTLVVDLTVVDPDQIEVLASGTCGTCPWELDATGTLTISGGTLPGNDKIENGMFDASFWPWYEFRDRIVAVVTVGDVTCSGCLSRIFADCASLVAVDLSGWDQSGTWGTYDVFSGCSSLRFVRADGLVLGSNGLGFNDLASLESIEGIESWNTSQTSYMGGMFSGCKSLASLDLSGWDTSAVGSMDSMFSGCRSLTSLNLSGWDASLVTSMEGIFKDCSSLTTVDLTGWDTSQATNMSEMFSGCRSLKDIDVSSLDTENVTSMSNMFSGCASLTSLDLSSFDTHSVTNISSMLRGCISLVSLDISGFDLRGLRSDPYESFSVFTNCRALQNIKAYNLKFGSRPITFDRLSLLKEIEGVESWDVSQATTLDGMFTSCTSLSSLDLSSWDTSNVVNMNDMFYFCTSLANLNISGWDTSKVTSMEELFGCCNSLGEIDVSGFNTSHVKYFNHMFESCESLTAIDVSHFDTSAATEMQGMFEGCKKLKTLNVTGFDTSRVKSLATMFARCSSLTTLNVSKLNTSSCKYFSGMFAHCKALKSLNVSSWNTETVVDIEDMLYGCSSLTSFDVSKWNLAKLKYFTEMLDGCTKLTKLVVGAKSAKVAQALPLGTWTAKSSGKKYVKGKTTGEDAWTDAIPPAKTADTYTKTGKGSQSVEVSAKTVAVGSTVSLNAVATGGGKLSYKSSDTSYATVSSKGVVKGKKAGKVTITVTAAATSVCNKATKKVTVTVKKANPITAKAKKKTVKAAYSKVKKAAVTLASNIKVSKAQGKVTYKNASTTAVAKKIKINKSTGKITVPKGLAKGTYTVKVAVKAAGNSTYAARIRNVTFKVKVS